MKKIFEKNGTKLLLGVIIVIFALIVMFNEDKTPVTNNIENSAEIVSWSEQTQEDQYVVTVMASSTCGYCQAYNPVIHALQEEYGFTLYWFEIDNLSDDDYQTLSSTYDLENYEGSVPYTFITKNGEFVIDNIGALEEEGTLDFLKTNNVITE